MLTRDMIIKESVLEHWLLKDREDLFLAMSKNTIGEGEQRHVFIDNGAKILAVAHLDTVRPLSKKIKLSKNKLKASGLDDRLGAYLCAILATLDVHADILFTDNEETGRSTAQYFTTTKEYNWVVEFDRMGVDAVTYGLDSKEFIDDLKATGVTKSHGSFSDLCYLKLPNDPCMVNFGIGYYNPHADDSYARLQELVVNVNRFKLFYDRHKDTAYRQDSKCARHKGAKYATTKTTTIPSNSTDVSYVDGVDDMDEWERKYMENWKEKNEVSYMCIYCGHEDKVPPMFCRDCGAEDSYFQIGAHYVD